MSEQRVAIVTGAVRGIGAAVVERLTGEGWQVVGIDLDGPEDDVPGLVPLTGDATSEDLWEEALASARDLGGLAAIVNNAGTQGRSALLAETALADYRRTVGINLDSAFLGTRLGLREMREGAIVNIASNAGSRGVPRFGPYVAAKHAVIGLTRTAALEGAHRGVRVNAVAPGPTDTRIMADVAAAVGRGDAAAGRERLSAANPTRRFATVEEIAGAVAWLVSPASIYVNGAVLAVDGGLTAA